MRNCFKLLPVFVVLLLTSFFASGCLPEDEDGSCGDFDTLTASTDQLGRITLNWKHPCVNGEAFRSVTFDLYRFNEATQVFDRFDEVWVEEYQDWMDKEDYTYPDMEMPDKTPGKKYTYEVHARYDVNLKAHDVSSNEAEGALGIPKDFGTWCSNYVAPEDATAACTTYCPGVTFTVSQSYNIANCICAAAFHTECAKTGGERGVKLGDLGVVMFDQGTVPYNFDVCKTANKTAAAIPELGDGVVGCTDSTDSRFFQILFSKNGISVFIGRGGSFNEGSGCTETETMVVAKQIADQL